MSINSPNTIITALGLTPGSKVADFGCGHGHYIREVEDKIGLAGKIYAIDIQKPLLDSLVNKNKEAGFSNIIPIWIDLEHSTKTQIQSASLDAVVLANILFVLPQTGPLLREANRILKESGKLLIVDWEKPLAKNIPATSSLRTKEELEAAVALAGFKLAGHPPAGNHQYAIMCTKHT